MAAFPNMVLTNAGIALQTKVLAGATLTFTRIGLGSGELNGSPISPLTALINQTATVDVSDVTVLNANTCQAEGFFSNEDIQQGFQWRETGLFAQDPDAGEILYSYTNAGDAGDYIPTVEDTRIEKYIYCSVAVANATTVTIDIPQNDTFIPMSQKGAAGGVATLDEDGTVPASQLPDLNAADTKLSNLDTPQEALHNLGAGVKPNLLKNAYFVGGGSQQGGEQFPINQQGQTIYNSSGNIFDGWKIVGSGLSVSLEPDGISLVWSASGVLWQTFNNLSYFSGKTVTMSALVSQVNIGTTNNIILRCRVNGSWGSGTTGIKITQSGLATFTFTLPESIQSLSFEIGADSGSCKCYAAKLEEGTEQTLAYQDEGGTWQLLPQPDSDYTTQLLKCQFPGPTGVQDTITEAVSEHNTSDEAHEDIRTAIDGKANVNHAAADTSYGAGSDTQFGHVKVTPGNGLAIAGGVVNMGAASGSAAGAVTTGEQTFAGDKTFSGQVDVANPAPTAQAVRNMYAGTSDMEAGTTELTTGLIYLMYE